MAQRRAVRAATGRDTGWTLVRGSTLLGSGGLGVLSLSSGQRLPTWLSAGVAILFILLIVGATSARVYLYVQLVRVRAAAARVDRQMLSLEGSLIEAAIQGSGTKPHPKALKRVRALRRQTRRGYL
jgi:hypothetical protein